MGAEAPVIREGGQAVGARGSGGDVRRNLDDQTVLKVGQRADVGDPVIVLNFKLPPLELVEAIELPIAYVGTRETTESGHDGKIPR
jgi:hypothetical protein